MLIKAYPKTFVENECYSELTKIFGKHILISIASVPSETANLEYAKDCPECKGILALFFDHSNLNHIESKNDLRLVTDSWSKQLLSFVDKYINEINGIVINCEAGISRSQGVSAALNAILNESFGLRYNTNKLIYSGIIYEYYSSCSFDYPNLKKYELGNIPIEPPVIVISGN